MFHYPERYRKLGEPNHSGAFVIPFISRNLSLIAIASNELEWEHVSVSLKNRCPNWPEMCQVKDLFWDEEDCVMQLHPIKSGYVNNMPYCLHLWRPINDIIPVPPKILVGI